MLAEIKGEPGYTFSPYGFITDEAGAIINGIRDVYGEAGVLKTIPCQFHFRQGVERQLRRMPNGLDDIKQEFEMLAMQMLSCITIADYDEIKHRLEQLAALVPSIGNWLQWWSARRYNLFPVFRGYCISSLNLAEIGHSTLKKKKLLMLVDASWEDVATMILQNEAHTKFLQGRDYSHGQGPTLQKKAMKSKREQLKRSRQYQENFLNGQFQVHDMDPCSLFIPNKPSKHKDPDANIVQGNFQSSIFPQNKYTTSCVSLLPSGVRVIQSNGAQNQQKLVSQNKANTTTLTLLPSSVRVLTSKAGKSQHTVSL